MRPKPTIALLLACFLFPVLQAAGQALPPPTPLTPEQRGNQALLSGVDLLAAGDAEGAVRVLNNIAGTTTSPALVQRAQCYGGAAMTVGGDIRTAEQLVDVINRSAVSNPQAGWKVTLPECVKQLEGIAPRLDPVKRASLFYFLGLVGTDEGDHVRFLRQCVALRPDFGEAAYQLGVHLLAFGQMDEAAGLFRRVGEQHPEWAEPRANLGIVYNLTGKPADAVVELREAIKIRPDYAEAHGQLGLALYITGQYDEALEEVARSLRAEPDNPFNYNCAAVILLEKSRITDAVAYARRAVELAPRHETFLVVLAAAQLAAGQDADATTTMARAITVQPRLRDDASRLEKADLLRGRALALAGQLLQKVRAASTIPGTQGK